MSNEFYRSVATAFRTPRPGYSFDGIRTLVVTFELPGGFYSRLMEAVGPLERCEMNPTGSFTLDVLEMTEQWFIALMIWQDFGKDDDEEVIESLHRQISEIHPCVDIIEGMAGGQVATCTYGLKNVDEFLAFSEAHTALTAYSLDEILNGQSEEWVPREVYAEYSEYFQAAECDAETYHILVNEWANRLLHKFIDWDYNEEDDVCSGIEGEIPPLYEAWDILHRAEG